MVVIATNQLLAGHNSGWFLVNQLVMTIIDQLKSRYHLKLDVLTGDRTVGKLVNQVVFLNTVAGF